MNDPPKKIKKVLKKCWQNKKNRLIYKCNKGKGNPQRKELIPWKKLQKEKCSTVLWAT
jgi:hypothetical protein